MTLQNNIRESLLYFPTIYDNALDVLYHLFCVIGNWYEWVNGELVECSGRERTISVKDVINYNIARRLNSENINSTIESAMLLLDIDEKNPDFRNLSKTLSDRQSAILEFEIIVWFFTNLSRSIRSFGNF